MNRIFTTVLYIAATLFVAGCAKSESVGPNAAYQRYFDAWMSTNHPQAEPTGLGIYIIDENEGDGIEVKDKGFVLLDYITTDLEGNISNYTDATTSKQLGEYSITNYYGPKFLTTVETTLPAGLANAIVGSKVGTYREVIIPSWLMSYKSYDSEKDYLNPPLEKDESYDASSFSNTIYRFTIKDYTENINDWQVDSIGRFFKNNEVRIDGKPASEVFVKENGISMTAADSTSIGFYYKQLKAPENTKEFAKDTTIYINYVGKLLNGLVFDTNIERVAKDNGLYSSSATYKPSRINWGASESEITMGDNKSTIITGFAKTLWQMKAMEKGVGVFYSDWGYGYNGSGASIPGYSTLIFEIELVEKPEE